MDSLGFSLVNLLIACAAVGNTLPTTHESEWIPVILADNPIQATSTGNSDWKATEPLYDFAEATEKITKTVTPDQFQRKNLTTQYNIFEQDLLPEVVKDSTRAPSQDNDLKVLDPKDYRTKKSFPYIQMSEKGNGSIDFEFNTEPNQRTSKQIKGHNFVKDIRNLYENVMKMRTTDARFYMTDREGSDNYYDVTEPTDEEEKNERNSRGYIYKKPVVEPVGLTTARNEFSERLQDNLKKYNIKSNDMLNNYAISKNYVNNYDSMFQMYRTHVAPVVAIPFRYNRLNHLPVNPLLGVLLSNYGYYVQGGNGLPNYYRNLYGFAANQIYNDRSAGPVPSQRSYKMYYDTDADN